MPGAVPYTSTVALTNVTLPYVLRLANMGWKEACKADPGLAKGLNVVGGELTYKGISEAFGWQDDVMKA
jgi:alanine dehydrogenase